MNTFFMFKHSKKTLSLFLLLSTQAAFCPKWINGPERNTATAGGSRRTASCKYQLDTFEDIHEVTTKQAANIYESLTSTPKEERAYAFEKLAKIKANLETLPLFFEERSTIPTCVPDLIGKIISNPDYRLSFDELIAVTHQTIRELEAIEAGKEYAFYTTPYQALSSEQLFEVFRTPEYLTSATKGLSEELSKITEASVSEEWFGRELESIFIMFTGYRISIPVATSTVLFEALLALGSYAATTSEKAEAEAAKVFSTKLVIINLTYFSNSIGMTIYFHPAFKESTEECDNTSIMQATIKMTFLGSIHVEAQRLITSQLTGE
jgi:hypothetical protein